MAALRPQIVCAGTGMDKEFVKIKFLGPSTSGKTIIWSVMDGSGTHRLGEISWYGRWRGYAFYPSPYMETVFEHKCLRAIADFIENANKKTRSGWRKKK